jgi:glycosyltransferase involved in cell wall biosynthesis
LLIGPGDVEDYSKEAADLGILDNAIFTGPVSSEEVKGSYDAADVFVFASQTETQGLVIGEAMIANTPVVALKSPIQPEVYPESVSVVVRDEAKFAEEVDKLLKNPDKQKKLAELGKKFVEENFSCEQMTKKQIEVFEKALSPAKVG